VQPVDLADGCPSCGVISARVHAWIVQRVRDIPHAGQLEVVVRKPRLVCAEPECPRGTFTPATEQLPVRARCTTRLRTALLSAVIDSGRAVAEVAADHGVAWWTVQATVNTAAVLLPNVDELHVRRLGIDEHRYRRVRWFRDPDGGGWRRVEPWMSTIVNADCGQVLGIVDGRDSAAVGGWLSERSTGWRNRIGVVAIDPSAAFKRAITEQLPNAKISVDSFHLVQLANLMVTRVRQRLLADETESGRVHRGATAAGRRTGPRRPRAPEGHPVLRRRLVRRRAQVCRHRVVANESSSNAWNACPRPSARYTARHDRPSSSTAFRANARAASSAIRARWTRWSSGQRYCRGEHRVHHHGEHADDGRLQRSRRIPGANEDGRLETAKSRGRNHARVEESNPEPATEMFAGGADLATAMASDPVITR